MSDDPEQPPSPVPPGTVTAYCAPGRTVLSAVVLALKNAHADRIVEHPWLAGYDDVILVREPEEPGFLPEFPVHLAGFETCRFCAAPSPRHNTWCLLRPSFPVGMPSLLMGLT